jgi:DNA-binding transcriptional ArsR family regulator
MIRLIRGGEEWTVGKIAVRMKIAQPVASKHLQVLKKVGIVKVVKRGRFRCYRLHALSLRPIAEWAESASSECE